MPPKLRLIWEEKDIDSTYNELNFRSEIERIDFLFAEITPPLSHRLFGQVEYVHFSDLKFGALELVIYNPISATFDLRKIDIITINIINPMPLPIPVDWNRALYDDETACHGHIFYYDPKLERRIEESTFLRSFSVPWSGVVDLIQRELVDRSLGSFGISAGFLDGTDVFPKLNPLHKSFESYKSGKMALIIIVSSFAEFTLSIGDRIVSAGPIPTIPKKLVSLASNFGNTRLVYSAIRRRVLKTLFNGGIPVNFFGREGLFKIPASRSFPTSVNFDSVELELKVCPPGDEMVNYNDIFKLELTCLETLNPNANEATLRISFWDRIFFTLFRLDSNDGRINFETASEWNTSALFPGLDARRIDMTGHIQIKDQSFPIFQVEIGNQNFNLSNPHKDLSKMLATMSLACIELAHSMAQDGKRPEDARVFGIWIGGTSYQLCVAHAVVTLLPDGQCDIHANLTFKDDWFRNILVSNIIPHNFIQGAPSERIVPGITNWNLVRLSEFPEQQRDILLSVPPIVEATSIVGTRYTDFLDVSSVLILHNFIRIMKARIDIITSSVASDLERSRIFQRRGRLGAIGASRPASESETPKSKKTKQQFAAEDPKTPTKSIQKSKRSLSELEIRFELSKYPQLYPQMYNYQIEQNDTIKYEFEHLDPLKDEFDCISERIDLVDDHQDILFNCLLFGVQTIYGLQTLHETVGIIHSDLSPSNIMYSELCRTWKLNDYDHSMRVEKSLLTSRTAGTLDFIAPEAEITGIFTKESDVYSLGQVMSDCISPVIFGRIMRLKDLHEEIEPDPELSFFARRIFHVIYLMTSEDPTQRPVAIQALEQFIDIMKDFMDTFEIVNSNEILREAQVCIDLHRIKAGIQTKAAEIEKGIEKVELKKSKLMIEEKDIITPHVLPGPMGRNN